MPDVQREILPVPDRTYPGLTTYDARDPDTSFPPIGRLRPPRLPRTSSARRCLVVSPWPWRSGHMVQSRRGGGVRRTPRSLPVFSTRRRREHCKNPNAAGQAVWVDARQWGSVGMTARD
jgi:hypothetical protein